MLVYTFTFFFSLLKPGLSDLPFCQGHHPPAACLGAVGGLGGPQVQVHTHSETAGACSPFKAVRHCQDPSLRDQNAATDVSARLALQGALPRPPPGPAGPTAEDPLVHASSRATAAVW